MLSWETVFAPLLPSLPLPVALTAAALSAVGYFGSEWQAGAARGPATART